MEVHLLLLLVCLCTLYSHLPVLALQKEVSKLDAALVEFVHQKSSHDQQESSEKDLVTIYHIGRKHAESSMNDLPVHARRLLSLGYRHLMASKVQDDKKLKIEHNTTSVDLKKSTSTDTKPQDDAGHESSSHNKSKSGGKDTDITPPPAIPEGKEREVAPIVDDRLTNNNTVPEMKPKAPAVFCGESHCEDPTKLVSACLRIPGDGVHELALLIANAGDSEVQIKVVAPEYLVAHPTAVSVSKDKSETIQFVLDSKYEASTLDVETVNKTITVTTDNGNCEIGVPVEYLRSSILERKPQVSSYLPSVTPQVAAYLAVLVLVGALVGVWLCYKCCWKKRARDVKYQQLEMTFPGQTTPKDRDDQHVDRWDEAWDDDWEDAEAAKSSSRLTQNLSSRGLGARRGNKDGWDD